MADLTFLTPGDGGETTALQPAPSNALSTMLPGGGAANLDSSGITGTWASTEATDVMLATAAPKGTWASTEAADTFAAAGYPQLTGTFAATEAKDVFAATGKAGKPLDIDGFATGGAGGSGITTATVTLTTTNPDDVIVLCATVGGAFNHGVITGIANTAGLTWTKRKSHVHSTDANVEQEIWWAVSPLPLTADVITVTTTATGAIALTAFGVQGANTGVVWDANAGLTYVADNGGTGNPTSSVSTDMNHDTLIFSSFATNGNIVPTSITGAILTGFLTAEVAQSEPAGNTERGRVAYGIVTTKQTSQVVSFGQVGGSVGVRMFLTDAIVGAGYFGTWGSTEAPDTMAVVGSTLGGSWHSTEATDTMAAAGYPQLTGTWASVEANDALSAAGYPQLTGTMAATEASDIFAAVGSPVPALGLDGFANGGASGSAITSGAVTLTTTKSDDVIVVMVNTGGFFNHGVVTSITDVAGLTWKKRHQRLVVGANPSVECWWAHAPSPLTGNVITVHTSSTGAISIIAFGVQGANYTTPWDKNVQAGWFLDNYGSGNALSPVRSDAHDTFLLAFYAGLVSQDGTVTNGDYTWIAANSHAETSGQTMYAAFAAHIAHTPVHTAGYQVGFGQVGGAAGTRTVMTDAIVAFGQAGTDDAIRWHFDGYMPVGPGIRTLTGAANSVTTQVRTFEGNEVVVAAVLIESGGFGATVSGITDTSGGTSGWTRRSRTTNNLGTIALEIWYAWTTSAFASSDVTVTCSSVAAGDTIAFTCVGINGPNSFQIWDTHGSLPALAHHDAPPATYQAVTGVSTINPNCLVLGFGATGDQNPHGFNVLPFVQTGTDATSGNGPAGFSPLASSGPPANVAVEFNFTHDFESNATIEFDTSPKSNSWIMIADALPVGPPTPPTGVWASIEGVDVVNAAGYVPAFATWDSVEAPDRFTGAPAQAPYNSIGWLGWVPAFATWASTEAKDHLSGAAWVIGQPLTGQWHSVESKDRFAASNRATVTGVWASQETPDNLSSTGFLLPKAAPAPPTRKRRLMVIN